MLRPPAKLICAGLATCALLLHGCRPTDQRSDLERLASSLGDCVPRRSPWDSHIVLRLSGRGIVLDTSQGCISVDHDESCIAAVVANFAPREEWTALRAFKLTRRGSWIPRLTPLAADYAPSTSPSISVLSCSPKPIDPRAYL